MVGMPRTVINKRSRTYNLYLESKYLYRTLSRDPVLIVLYLNSRYAWRSSSKHEDLNALGMFSVTNMNGVSH